MTLNNYFTIPTHDFDDRPKPKVWLLKPDFTRIERLTGVSKLNGTFKANNLNTLTGQISPTVFDSVSHKQKRNPVFDLIKNKYLIEFHYNGFKDFFVIDDIKNVSSDSDNITFTAESLATELNKKAANEIEMLGSPIRVIMDKVLEAYAPLWSVDYIDAKLAEVKRELTMTNTTVMGMIDELNKLFDSVVVFNNKNRKISFYHKDNVGVNRGLRIRENSYLKSFEDSLVSKDVITRLYPFGNNGLTIQSVNPAGTDYIEDFSYFMSPFKRDAQKNVLQHSDYMSDNLCHALLDYQEFFEDKKDLAEEYTKRYSDILKEYTQESFTLNQLSATLQRLQDRVEILKPKSEYIELGTYKRNFDFYTTKSSYYLLMVQNKGNLANIKYGGKNYDVPANDWLYIKIKTGAFQDAEKFEEKLKHTVEVVSSNVNLRVILTRSSESDFEEDTDKDNKYLEQKYNLPKYEELVYDQTKVVNAIEKRMKIYEEEKASLIKSMSPKLFLTEDLYKERESYIFAGIWTEENHTEAKDLFEDALKQMKKQKEINRSVTVGLVNFTQSLEHKRDWDKLNVGDVIVFSNKIFNKKLKAYITDIQINFEDNQVTLTVSDVIDYVDESKKVAELIATASSTSTAVNFHKEQIKQQQGKMTAMTQLIEAEWDANKKRIMAGNETVDIGAHGIKVVSNNNPDEYVAIVGGVIALTRDGGNTFKTGVTPEGVNAETLIGKIFIGEDLELENESGTVKFNKNGFTADVSSFTLTTNDGKEDYFEKLKNDIREESKMELERVKQSLDIKINQVSDEAGDVQNIVDNAINNFQEAFKDGIISNVESKMIRETLAQLEKENNEYIVEIDKALDNPYISSEDIVELNSQKESYESMYTMLVEDINKSIADKRITAEESDLINQSIVNFRDGIQEVLALLKEILARTLDNQIIHSTHKAIKYTDRMKDDIKDELSDLKKAMNKANETIENAMKDNVFDAVEIENIKTMLMILKSEQEDVINRYTSVYSNPYLSATLKTPLKQKKDFLTKKYEEYADYVNEMIKDGKSDDTERVNYQLKYKNLTDAQTEFFKEYDNAVIAISKSYTDTREGQLNANIDGLKTEFNNDLKDIKDNMKELAVTINDTFKDGIITSTELNRLTMHLDMLDREYLDVEERYKEIINNEFLPDTQKNNLGAKRSPYAAAHSDLRQSINIVIQDGLVSSEEKNSINTKLSTYNTSFAAYTTAIQAALNTISRNVASDIADEKVKSFNPVLESISTNITAIQKQVDSAIDTYYYGYDPTLSNVPSSAWTDNKTKDQHIGDLFLNTKTGIAFRFLKNGSAYQWQRIEDQAIADALNRAEGAMDLADNKRRVFVATPKPPYDIGDLWMQGTSGDAMVCFTPKTSSQVYASSDWVKAVKYTDDSKANAVLSELNSFKSSTSTDITNLKSQTDLFKKDIYDAFDDKVISMSEASAIKSRFYQISDVKKRLENKYFTLIANPDLIGNPKANLTTQYNNLLTKYNTLETTINSAISDNKITDTENKNTKAAFDNFLIAIQSMEKSFDDAFTAIITNIATSKAQVVQDRFDTWKNSEFTTTSEGIVQRVSEANWKDKYFPQVTSKIDNIQIGGRNLFQSYNENFKNDIHPDIINTGSFTGAYWANNLYNAKYLKTVLQKGVTYTISYDLEVIGLSEHSVVNEKSHGIILYSNTVVADRVYFYAQNIERKIGSKARVVGTFVSPEITDHRFVIYSGLYSNDGTSNMPRSSNTIRITNLKLEKGNKATDWSPAPEDIDNKLIEQGTKIDSATSFIEQNKEKIVSSVTKAEVEGQLSKVTTNQNSYQVIYPTGNVLTEFYGTPFSDNYTYEVTAKNTSIPTENVASAVFVSKGVNKGFELVELENKGTTGLNPKFMLNVYGQPAVSVYSPSGTQNVEVIYTKYMGDASTIKTAKSMIDQRADQINIEVKRVEELTLKNNMLINSDFSNSDTGWRYNGDKSNWSFPSTDSMSINTDNNLLLTSEYNNNIVGSGTNRRIELPLSSPLVSGRTYTLKFKLTCDTSIKSVTVYPYKPVGTSFTMPVDNDKMSTFTFKATNNSTNLLIYVGLLGSTSDTSNFILENATLIEGNVPLEYSNGSSKGVARYVYNNTTDSYPSLFSDKMRVDKSANFSIGDKVTFSVYVYIPSSSKDILTEDLYSELAVYENTKQTSNPSICRSTITKSDFVYDTWVRYSCTGTIPSTSENGKTKYISALMRFKGKNQNPNSNAVFYYALPQLEKGPNATAWTPSQLDSINSEGLATKISLNPDSIEMISNNLRINTDILSIKNSNSTLTMKGDTLSITDTNGNNSTKINPKGMTIVSDGVEKMVDGLTYTESTVQAYEPQNASHHIGTGGAKISDARYMAKPIVFPGVNGLYALDWGGYNLAKSNKDLVENNGSNWARVNRYSYLHNQRYLKINLSCTTTGPVRLHLRWMDTTGGNKYHEEIITSESFTFPKPVIDLGKPDNKIKYFELQAGLTQGTANFQSGEFRITRMSMSNFKDFK